MQHEGGPCGVLASLNALFAAELLADGAAAADGGAPWRAPAPGARAPRARARRGALAVRARGADERGGGRRRRGGGAAPRAVVCLPRRAPRSGRCASKAFTYAPDGLTGGSCSSRPRASARGCSAELGDAFCARAAAARRSRSARPRSRGLDATRADGDDGAGGGEPRRALIGQRGCLARGGRSKGRG